MLLKKALFILEMQASVAEDTLSEDTKCGVISIRLKESRYLVDICFLIFNRTGRKMGSYYTYVDNENYYIKCLKNGAIGKITTEKNTPIYDVVVNAKKGLALQEETPSIVTIYIVLTMMCNLGCPYCFENDKKRCNSIQPARIPLINAIVSNIVEEKNPDIINIVFTGGEPMLRFDVMERLVNGFSEEFGERCQFHLITNGTVMLDEQISFFAKKRFCIQISIDGDRRMHDSLRTYVCDGKGTYHDILRNIERICAIARNAIGITVRVNIGGEAKYDFGLFFRK